MTAPLRAVRLDDLDQRITVASGRTDRLQVLVDHDTAAAGRCLTCGWATTPTRDCPSRTVALCLLDGRPLPSRLAHLAGRIPGAGVPSPKPTDDERRTAEDARDGLFPAPRRVAPRRSAT